MEFEKEPVSKERLEELLKKGKADELIDDIVYELYGLTEDETKIVKGV
jgi:hypothetical protein